MAAYRGVMAKMPSDESIDWHPNLDVARWASKHGFGESVPLTEANLRALAREHGANPVGLYLWETASHDVYIGISNSSVTNRLRQHVRDRPDANIKNFRYRRSDFPRLELRELERDLVEDAIKTGLIALNREYAATIVGESPFDQLISCEQQRLWLDHRVHANLDDTSTLCAVAEHQMEASASRFAQFAKMESAPEIIQAIGMYLTACVPYPRRTIYSHWGLSCLPGTRIAGGRRLVTLNMRVLEMLWFSSIDGATRVSVGTDYRFLPAFGTRMKLRAHGAHLVGGHRSGGPYEQVLRFDSIDTFIRAFGRSEAIREAAGRFALDRMRMGRLSGRYLEAHNYLLAEKVLASMGEASFAPASRHGAEGNPNPSLLERFRQRRAAGQHIE